MDTPQSETEWLRLIQNRIDEGQCFIGYDLAVEARQRFPESQKLALLAILTLLRSGALHEARKLLNDIQLPLIAEQKLTQQLQTLLQHKLPQLLTAVEPSSTQQQSDWLKELADTMVALGTGSAHSNSDDLETLVLAAQVHAESWWQQEQPEDLKSCYALYLQAFRIYQDPESGTRSARYSWLLGEQAQAQQIAKQVLATYQQLAEPKTAKDHFWYQAHLAETHLLAGDPMSAERCYQQAVQLPQKHYAWIAEARKRLLSLKDHGFDLPPVILKQLRTPVIVIGAGQLLDRPQATQAIFPAQIEHKVAEAIRQQLELLQADIGYCSAAAGTDLLFIEALLERDAEVHLVLPCATEDFLSAQVAYAGPRWKRRFQQALKLATSITYATEEGCLGHEQLLRFNNQMIQGLARLRGEFLGTEPYLLLVWDYGVPNRIGTAADFMDHWSAISHLRIIELDRLRESEPSQPYLAKLANSPQTSEPQRITKTMLFADIVGFSQLAEETLPKLWDYLSAINACLATTQIQIDLIESWGDAFYIVIADARSMLHYAFQLQSCLQQMDSNQFGIPDSLRLRVGLHAGPVYTGHHPFTNRPIVYGSHVSRTARIEPITIPGHIYASQQFVALLTAEESCYQAEQLETGHSYTPWYRCEYLGILKLAKQYGNQPVYHLLPRTLSR